MKLKIISKQKTISQQPLPGAGEGLPRRIIEYGLLALIVFSPLPAASVNEWSILVIQLVVLLMTGAYVLMNRKPIINSHLAARLGWPSYVFTALFALLAFQVVPLPKFIVRLLSPATYAFHKAFAPGFANRGFLSLSVAPAQTFREGLELMTYVLVGFLLIRTITRGNQIRRIILFLVGMGAFEALYGLYELSTKNPHILFYKKIYNLESVTGTFVNRSHFSGYLEMIVPLAIGLIIARMDIFSMGGEGLKEKILHMAGKRHLTNILLTAAVIVMSLGIIFSQSRAGIFVLVFTFILFLEFIVFHFSRFGPRRRWIRNFIGITFLLITIIALYIGIGSTIQRFALDNLLQESRPLYWSNVTRIIAAFPILGTGLGTFVSVYPAYEKLAGPELLLVHAHNDLLEYFSELGAVGMVFLLGGILYMGLHAFLSWRERKNPDVKGIVLGGTISLIVILIHSLTDFNLHIPANMLLFAIVLSLTFVTAYYRKA
jgi:O-antigen ligase